MLGGLEHWLGGVLDWPMYLKMAGIDENDGLEGRKSRKIVVWQGFGLGAPLGIHGAIFSKFLPKLGGRLTQDWRRHANLAPKWVKLGPSWRPDVPT